MIRDKNLSFFVFPFCFSTIYFSYFHFSEKNYFYFFYKPLEILVAGIFIFLFFSIIQLICHFIAKKIFLITLFDSLIFSSCIYVIFHYLVRFADFNYYIIYLNLFNEGNSFLQYSFYGFPFIISFIGFFFISRHKVHKIFKFLSILLLILGILSFLRIYKIYDSNIHEINKADTIYSENKNSKNFDKSIKKKVFWIIFDELDLGYLKKNIEYFPNIKNLVEKSFNHENFFTPGMYTLDSMPSLIMGVPNKETIIKNGNIFIKNYNDQEFHFNHENSIFGKLEKKNLSSTVVGGYHPYCKILDVSYCLDEKFLTPSELNLWDNIYILAKVTFLTKVININKLKKIDGVFKTKFFYSDNPDIFFSKRPFDKIAKMMFDKTPEFIRKNNHLTFIHYPYPHLPLQVGLFDDLNFDEDLFSNYEKNFFLVEKTVKILIDEIDNKNKTLLILSSDHWFKERNLKESNKAYPVAFISKISGDNNKILLSKPTNGTHINNLILDFFDNKINSHKDIESYFKNTTNHGINIK